MGVFSQALGGDDEFQRVQLIAMHFTPLFPTLYLGLRGDGAASFGDAPFYLRPFISLRGVPIMRYQGDEIAQIETELRWQFWKRFSLVGFVGGGAAWNDFERFNRTGRPSWPEGSDSVTSWPASTGSTWAWTSHSVRTTPPSMFRSAVPGPAPSLQTARRTSPRRRRRLRQDLREIFLVLWAAKADFSGGGALNRARVAVGT